MYRYIHKKCDGDLRDIFLELYGYHYLAYNKFEAAKLLTGCLEKESFQLSHRGS